MTNKIVLGTAQFGIPYGINNNKLVSEFIKMGADVNITDINGKTVDFQQKGGGNVQKIKGKRIL